MRYLILIGIFSKNLVGITRMCLLVDLLLTMSFVSISLTLGLSSFGNCGPLTHWIPGEGLCHGSKYLSSTNQPIRTRSLFCPDLRAEEKLYFLIFSIYGQFVTARVLPPPPKCFLSEDLTLTIGIFG